MARFKKRVSCDLIDSDGFVVGRAYALNSGLNDRFCTMALKTNELSLGSFDIKTGEIEDVIVFNEDDLLDNSEDYYES